MKYTFMLPILPMSLNQCEASTRGGRRYKTKKFKAWREHVTRGLETHLRELQNLFEGFDSREEIIALELKFGTPYLRTKSETINKKSIDLDNIFKPIVDEIFSHLEVDDAFICEIHGSKQYSNNEFMEITLERK